jgi:hypothetical protein
VPSHSPTRAAARPATRRRRTTRCLLLLGVVVLYAISIPWYRSDDQPLRLWLGFPDWVTTALLCYFAAAALNFAAWHLTEIPEPESDGDGACETDA